MAVFTHAIAVLLSISTVFLISATLNTISSVLFHFVGCTVILSLIYYDVVDVNR